MPVTGSRRMLIATLMNACTAIIVTIPTASSCPSGSGERETTRRMRNKSRIISANSTIAPTKPSSSPNTLKMKSVV